MTKIIRNKVIGFRGGPGMGKTFIMTTIAFIDYYCVGGDIYSNVEIFYKGKKITHDINDIKDIEKLEFQNYKSVVLLDEFGINNNARNSMSQNNAKFNQLIALSRKLNVDILWGTQLGRQTDVIWREMSNFICDMTSTINQNSIDFQSDINSNNLGKDYFLGNYDLDLVGIAEHYQLTYNTLEKSKITNNGNVKKEKKILELPVN